MAIIIFHGEEARKKVLCGINKIADAVQSTLGPGGRPVIIGKEFGNPHASKDGVTVAKNVDLPDEVENAGAQFVKANAMKTNDQAGDGTTTSTVIARGIVQEGNKSLAAGVNPTAIKRGIDRATHLIVKSLKKQAKAIQSNEQIVQISTVSANGDETIGRLIADTMSKVGKDGVITVQEGKEQETTVEVVEGMKFDKGVISPYFFTHPQKMRCVLENPYILITDKKITNLKDILPILEQVAKTGKQLLIIAENVEGEPLTALIVNKLKGVLVSAAVKSPGFGDRRGEILRDIAILTGGVVICEEEGLKLENVTLAQLGRAEKITIDKGNTTLIKGAGSKEAIDTRIAQIRAQMEAASSDYEKEKLRERLAKLAGGVAVISVGAPTEVEMKERKDRIEDSLNATKAALEEGILPGGGVAYIRACNDKEVQNALKEMSEDERRGAAILIKALEGVALQIANNAGVNGHVVVQKIKEGTGDFGYNAAKHIYGSLYQEGVIDPAKVVRLAIETASSTGSVVLTSECVIVQEKSKEVEGVPNRGMPGMM